MMKEGNTADFRHHLLHSAGRFAAAIKPVAMEKMVKCTFSSLALNTLTFLRFLKEIAPVSLLLGTFLLSFYAPAQPAPSSTSVQFNDSVSVDVRSFSEETIRRFQEDSDFDYGIRRKATLSWWDRLKYWIAQQWAKLFRYTYFGTIYNILFYIFCFSVIVFAILQLTGTSVSQLFRGRHDRGLVQSDLLENNIHTIDFEREIAQAQQDGDYRRGIRLLYIYTLKKLTDRQLIRWRPGKTNHDYQAELLNTPWQDAFEQLSYYYEYAWYGNFPTDEAMYRRVAQLFYQVDSVSQARA